MKHKHTYRLGAMLLARRLVLLGAVAGLTACAGDPTIIVPEGAAPRVRESNEPVQAPQMARAASLVAGVLGALGGAEPGPWRNAAMAQCEAHLARFNSPNPYAEPQPYFTPRAATAEDLAGAVTTAVAGLVVCADEAEGVSDRLLFLSAAAATSGLADTSTLPAEGGDPTFVETLAGQRQVALRHAWALVHGLEVGLGKLQTDEPLRAQLAARLPAAKALRNVIRDGFDGVAPSQPAVFALPTPMEDVATIREGWATLEVRLLEALVLLAADEPGSEPLWPEQVSRAQAAGGRIPRWPGWD